MPFYTESVFDERMMMRRKATVSCGYLVAVLALSASFATGVAHGNNLTAGSGAATLTGVDVNTEHGKLIRMTFGNGARYVECTSSTMNSSIVGPTTVLTMGSNFTNCSSNGVTSVPATVTNNGCDYVFEATKKSLARTSVKCAKATEQIEVHIYENETRHKENKPLCTYDLKPQGPATGIEIEHIEIGTKKESLVLHFNLKFAVTSTLGNVAVCGVGAPPAETMVTLTGDYLLAGFNGALLTPIMIE